MNSEKIGINKFMRFEFFPLRKYPNGNIDEVCRRCGEWVVEKSSFQQRYYHLYGNWRNEIPIGDNHILPTTINGETSSKIPICDSCIKEFENLTYPASFIIMHHEFIVQGRSRKNT